MSRCSRPPVAGLCAKRPPVALRPQHHAGLHARQQQQQQQAPAGFQGRWRGGRVQADAADSDRPPADEVPAAGKAEEPLPPVSTEKEQAQAQQQRPKLWKEMLLSSVRLVRSTLWPLLLTHATADTAVFLLHRISHRATNEAAVALLMGGALTPANIGNMWWLSVDPQLANFQTGYQPLTFVFFLLTFPLVVAVKSWAVLGTVLLCRQAWQPDAAQQQPADTPPPLWRQPLRGIRHGIAVLRSLSPQVSALWRRLFVVELLVASAVVPLTFASLAVVTIPFTLPIILDLQGAASAAVVEGVSGMAAVQRSQQLLRSVRWQLAVPFVGLLAARRLLEAAKTTLINAMPPRFYQELVEIPLVVLVGGTLLSVLLNRLADVLPFVAYAKAAEVEASSGGVVSGSSGAAEAGGGTVGAADSPA
ncbi:hypothetical protein D9Q98_006215 [Chlorella vulgaris]|uniref:Uncharacterized protein n=1 Tax=Chlorella vulgaris TaxID=3077 RepID=A0A9D4TXQ0_CHLVU|nr:hypothetical protein D9Q98_006215 [Chlorella vulgaris]